MAISLPAWPAPATDEGATFFDRARKLFSLYKAAGYDNPFAFAMMTMAEAELSFDPNALGDYVDEAGTRLPWSEHPTGKPSSYGAYQRKMERVAAIRDGVKIGDAVRVGLGVDIASLALSAANTLENEVRATLWELATFPSYGFREITSFRTAWGAAHAATITFERAGTVANGAAEKRGSMAETWVMLASGIWPKSRGDQPDTRQQATKGWV